jgi:hypothetical protein
MLRVLRRLPIGILVGLRRRMLPGMLRIRRRRLPVVGFLIASAWTHGWPGAGNPIRASKADHAAQRRQIDSPSAVGRRRSSPARWSGSAPKQREQVVKHSGYPAPGLGFAVSAP